MTDTTALAWVHFQRAPSELYLKTGADGAEFELVSQAASASLGDVAGQVISGIDVQLGTGSILTYVSITASDGGEVINVKGGERLGAGGSTTNGNINACLSPLSILVERGMTLNVLTAD